jgi:hypothetical protein
MPYPEIPNSIENFKKLTAAPAHLDEAGPHAIECSKTEKSRIDVVGTRRLAVPTIELHFFTLKISKKK